MKRWLVEQKFRVDTGFQLWPIINFALLVVAVSDKLLAFTGIKSTIMLMSVTLPCAFFSVWLVGYVLDKLRYTQGYNKIQAQRTPTWIMTVDYFEQILKEVRKK